MPSRDLLHRRTAPRPGRPLPHRVLRRPAGRALATGTVLAGAAALVGLAALAGLWPAAHPDPGAAWLAGAASPRAAVLVQTVAALVGAAGGIAGLVGALPRRAVAVLAAAELAVFGLVLQGTATLAVLGYLVAMALPAAAVVLLVQVVRRHPAARWAGVPALVLLAAGAAAGREPLAALAAHLGGALGAQAGRLVTVLLALGVGTAWAGVLATTLAETPGADRATAWVVRHRVAITVVAACGPLPYALVRLTWLTPWPLLGHEGIDLPTRIWGLALSGGAWLGVVLTLGLVRPWGEVFPRWVPGLAGRPVPVAAAAVPGSLVATAVTFAAVPMLLVLPDDGLVPTLVSAVVFPCWLWGPALALAVWGYVGHRTYREGRTAGRMAP
jgi:hypothetical protein